MRCYVFMRIILRIALILNYSKLFMLPVIIYATGNHWKSLFWSSDVPLVVLASLKQGSVGCRVPTTNRLIREILRNAHFSGQVWTCS